ncbi:MAG TPA: Panacea domain-containing protein [Pseudolabrys sp.]|nr:Panacea domain-containing protein [Pseudolabrys sp.]
MDFDKAKFKRLVHYVAWKAGKRDWFGAVKLNKVLWYADARTYVLRGTSITGETYVREKFGPVPRHIKQICTEMEREGTLKVFKEGKLTRVVATEPPDANWFSREELQSINYWIEHIDKEHTATSISDATHDYVWQQAKMYEELPLYAYRVLRIPEELRDEDLSRLKARAKELGLI